MRNFLLLITIAAALTISVSGQTVPAKKAIKVLVYDWDQIFGDHGIPQLLQLKADASVVCGKSEERRLEIESERNRRWEQLLDYSATYDQLTERKTRFQKLSEESEQVQKTCVDAQNRIATLKTTIRRFINKIRSDNNAVEIQFFGKYDYPVELWAGSNVMFCDPALDRTGQLRLAILSYLTPGRSPDVIPQLPETLPRVINRQMMFPRLSLGAYELGYRMFDKRVSDLIKARQLKGEPPLTVTELRSLIATNRDRLFAGLPPEITQFDAVMRDFVRSLGYDLVVASDSIVNRSSSEREDVTQRFRDYFVLRRSVGDATLSDRITIATNPSIIPK